MDLLAAVPLVLLVCLLFDRTATGLCTGPFTALLCGYLLPDGRACSFANFILLQKSNVLNDLAESRSPKSQCVSTGLPRSNAWIWRPFLVSPALKQKLKIASKWLCGKRKAVARGNPIFGSVEPCNLLETQRSLH